VIVRLMRESGSEWTIRSDKAILCTFSQIDAVEAKRFAEAWLTSFAHRIKLEVMDDSEQDKSEKTRST